MSYKVLQLSPLSTRSMHLRIMIQGPWSAPPPDFPDASFLRSWLVYDSGMPFGRDGAAVGFNWNALLGLLLAVGVSAGAWAGIGLSLSRLLK